MRHKILLSLSFNLVWLANVAASGQTFPITIDATQLSSTRENLQVICDSGVQLFDTSAIPQTLNIPAGGCFGQLRNGPARQTFFFDVSPQGTIALPFSESYMSVSGGTTLQLNGFPITVDGQLSFRVRGIPGFLGQTPKTLHLMPGLYFVLPQGPMFRVTETGAVEYAPSFDNNFFSGQGGTLLHVNGYPISLDVSQIGSGFICGDNLPCVATSSNLRLAPDTYRLTVNQSAPAVPGGLYAAGSIDFSVDISGKIRYPSSYEGILGGAGTNSLVVNGLDLGVALDSHLLMGVVQLPGLGFVFPGAATHFRVLPAQYGLGLAGTSIAGEGWFEVLSNGTVQYPSSFDISAPHGFLDGRGTGTLTVVGLPVDIFGSAIAPWGLAGGVLGVQDLHGNLVPGAYLITQNVYNNNQLIADSFYLGPDGNISVYPTHSPDLEANGNQLTIHALATGQFNAGALPVTVDTSRLASQSFRLLPYLCCREPIVSGQGQQQFTLAPGPYIYNAQGQRLAELGNSFVFLVNNGGGVEIPAGLNSFLLPVGSTLNVNGLAIVLDDSTQAAEFILDSSVEVPNIPSPTANLTPGAHQVEATGKGWFQVNNNGQPDFSAPNAAFFGQSANHLQLTGLPLTIDPTQLGINIFRFSAPGPDGIGFDSGPLETATSIFPALPTIFRIYSPDPSQFGTLAEMVGQVTDLGKVDFAASPALASGAGTTRLTATGIPVTINATGLAPWPLFGIPAFSGSELPTASSATLGLLPGFSLVFADGQAEFLLKPDSNLDLLPSETGYASVSGSTLVLFGRPVTIDARALKNLTSSFNLNPRSIAPGFEAGASFATSTATQLNVLPGSFVFSAAGFPTFHFSVGRDGLIDFGTDMDSEVFGRGTSTLIVGDLPPIANAGSAQTLACTSAAGAAVTLNGTGSHDPDGQAITYGWSGPFGTATGATPTVNLPLGSSTITLVVNDGHFSSTPAAVTDTVTIGVSGFQPPLAGLVPSGNAVPIPGNAFQLGRTLPLKLQLSCGANLISSGVAPPQIVALVRNGDALNLTTIDPDAGQANDNGLLFRASDGQWVYNLSTAGLSSGTYMITVLMPDGRRYDGGFVLR